MIFTCIVAGGTGSRMGLDRPKQFAIIKDKPLILYTLEKFLSVSDIDNIYIGCHKDWISYLEGQLELFSLDRSRITVTEGGSDRNETVLNCAQLAESEHPGGGHILITHDAVRPFVSREVILKNIEACKEHRAVGTYVPVTDTVIISGGGQTVDSVPKRSELYAAQTPQTFMLDDLLAAYKVLDDTGKLSMTDTCSAITLTGGKIHMVMGDYKNIKLTTAGDLDIARILL